MVVVRTLPAAEMDRETGRQELSGDSNLLNRWRRKLNHPFLKVPGVAISGLSDANLLNKMGCGDRSFGLIVAVIKVDDVGSLHKRMPAKLLNFTLEQWWPQPPANRRSKASLPDSRRFARLVAPLSHLG